MTQGAFCARSTKVAYTESSGAMNHQQHWEGFKFFHVTRGPGVDHPAELPHLLPAVLCTSLRSQRTQDAEAILGLPGSVYCFLGYPNPGFGNAVFVFKSSLLDGRKVSATPFDSGDVAHGRIRIPPSVTPRSYYHALSLKPPGGPGKPWMDVYPFWERVAAYVERHFSQARHYARGEAPQPCEPSGKCVHAFRYINNPNNRASWTWELQIHEDVRVEHSLLRVYVRPGVKQVLENQARSAEERSFVRYISALVAECEDPCGEAELRESP